MKRFLFSIFALLSLLLSFAVMVLWGRSYFMIEDWMYVTDDHITLHIVGSAKGRMVYGRAVETIPLNRGLFHKSGPAGALEQSWQRAYGARGLFDEDLGVAGFEIAEGGFSPGWWLAAPHWAIAVLFALPPLYWLVGLLLSRLRSPTWVDP